MPDQIIVVPAVKLKWKGIFDFEGLYKKMKFWLEFQGYGDERKNFREEKYVEQVKPTGKIYEIVWKGEKNISDYFSFIIKITFLGLNIEQVETQKEGKKVKMSKGEIEIKFTAILVKNRQNKWKPDSFIKKIYENFISRDRIEEYKIDIYKKLYELHDEVKAYLDLSRL